MTGAEGGDAQDLAGDAVRDRRRLLAMGGVLAEVTNDETDEGWGDAEEPGAGDLATDARLRHDVPPHHGG